MSIKHWIVFIGCCVLIVGSTNSCSEDDSIVENQFLGMWRIVQIQVSNGTLNQISPEEENITLLFENDSDYSGNTLVNQFSGRYRLDGSNTLTLLEFQTTEVADTQFGNAFFASISEAIVPDTTFAQLGFTFNDDTLTLTFGNGGRLFLERLQ